MLKTRAAHIRPRRRTKTFTRLAASVLVATSLSTLTLPTLASAAAKKTKATASKAGKPGVPRTKGKGQKVMPGQSVAFGPITAPPAKREFSTEIPKATTEVVNALNTARSAEERSAIWLGVYARAGIPVLDEKGMGIGTGGADPIGPSWWTVWMTSGSRFDHGMSFYDFARLMGSPDPATTQRTVAALVADIRAALNNRDPANDTNRFAASLIRKRMLLSVFLPTTLYVGGPDIMLDDFDPMAAMLDPATALFAGWAVTRGRLFSQAQSGVLKNELSTSTTRFGADGLSGSVQRFASIGSAKLAAVPAAIFTQADAPAPQPNPCMQFYGNDQVQFVANWAANKFLVSGISLPGGLEVKSFASVLAEISDETSALLGQVGKAVDRLGAANKALGHMNALMSIISFAMQLDGLSVAGDAPQLVRTKNTNPGAKVRVEAEIWYSPGKVARSLPDGNSRIGCALNAISSIVGAGFSFPAAGPLSGLSVEVTAGLGFKRIMFADYKQLKQTTNDNGRADVDLIGRPQSRNLDDPSSIDRYYSVRFNSTTDPLDRSSLFNTFFDGFTIAASPVGGTISVTIDILKTVRWNAGSLNGAIVDWKDILSICDPDTGSNFSGLPAIVNQVRHQLAVLRSSRSAVIRMC